MMNNNRKDPLLWKKKATAFVIRSHRQLWGRNNEDPLAFLFRMGLSNATIKTLYLGWNKFGQERHWNKWGIQEPHGQNLSGKKDCFLLAAGIIFPHIIEKELKSIWIHPMHPEGQISMVPGSAPGPVLLGDVKKPVVTTTSLFKGLCLFQDHKDTLCVKIVLPESRPKAHTSF
ncbi:hypothetical protein SAMN02746065_13032 [Desulfocicer vacuolatum DSM 3385]|uniref:Uncharacterized protein n=1 Tax=Desulfocicer vacuolatum DSM 3385 TaxID=1121400 RepID=A0A1W2EFF1_9BACT|nr:hypothetical protein [Desulfocicer vacuolatum]SMD08367.1 hypothetical protein SAMN02746065_13032 [Desulfocicer vacuolatum DSM 3385]